MLRKIDLFQLFSKTSVRLVLAFLVLLVGFNFAVWIYLNTFTQDIYTTRKSELQHIVSLANNTLEPIIEQKKQRKITLGEARILAAEAINRFIYSDDSGPNYVFLSTYDGYVLVEPFNPDSVGTYQMQRQDSDGTFITQRLLQAAKTGGGFVQYQESRTPGDTPQKKLSYVIGLPEIECYIGTGMYVADIDRTIFFLLSKLVLSGTVILLLTMCTHYFFLRPLLYGFSTLANAFKIFAKSPTSVPVFHLKSFAKGTETEYLIQSFKEMAEQIAKNRLTIEHSEEKFRLAAQAANDVIWDWSKETDSTIWTNRLKEIIGYLPKVTLQTHFDVLEDWVHPNDRALRNKTLADHFSGKNEFYSCEYRLLHLSGEYRWILAKGKAMLDNSGNPLRMVGTLTDITEKKLRDEKISQLAYLDTLTKLPNRAFLREYLHSELEAAEEGKSYGALMFLDLNDFKRVNDIFGHSSGDKLLIQIAKKIKYVLGERGLLVRLGGDEFVILAAGMNDVQAEQLAEELVRESACPYKYQDETFYVTGSIGIAIYPEDACDSDTLLSKADMAMYHAKENMSTGYARFVQSMQEEAMQKLKLESLLSKAIERNEMQIHYQPQIDLKTGQAVSFEALLRWNRSGKGFVPPNEFIPIAEESGLIIPIGRWVMEKSCNFCLTLHEMGFNEMIVTVNISIKQLEQPDFVKMIQEVLISTGLSARYLEIEITESLFMRSFESCILKLKQIRDLGVRLALDDFGTGYSSLTYLRHLPIQVLKIDKEFITDLTDKDWAIVETIILLSHALKIEVVVEGVETKEQVDFLTQLHCDRVQGYYFSRPIEKEYVLSYLTKEEDKQQVNRLA